MNRFINKLFLLLIGIFFLSVTILTAQNTFEGQVKIKVSSKNHSTDMVYYVKGKSFKIVAGTENHKESFLVNGDNFIVLMPEQKMYMEINKNIVEKFRSKMKSQNNTPKENFDINSFKTGKTKKILGYNCEQLKINNKNSSLELWITGELGNFMSMDNPLSQRNSLSWSSYFNNNAFFPMLVISKNKDGEISKFEVVDVEKKSLSDSVFQPPKDFKKMKMPGM